MSSNGRTRDSGSWYPGSNPGIPILRLGHRLVRLRLPRVKSRGSPQVAQASLSIMPRRSILSERAQASESKDGSTRFARSPQAIGERVKRLHRSELKDNIVWYVYLLECQNKDLYTGITDNLERRFARHAAGRGGHFTKSFGAKKILFSEEHSTKSEALKREAQIKGWTRKKKLALIAGDKELLKKL